MSPARFPSLGVASNTPFEALTIGTESVGPSEFGAVRRGLMLSSDRCPVHQGSKPTGGPAEPFICTPGHVRVHTSAGPCPCDHIEVSSAPWALRGAGAWIWRLTRAATSERQLAVLE